MSKTIQLSPPLEVRKAAQKGLDFRKQYGRGGTRIGINRAKQLISGEDLDRETIIKMSSYFARHAVDKKAKDFGNEDHPSNGYIAWLLWGGDAGQKWADDIKAQLKSKK